MSETATGTLQLLFVRSTSLERKVRVELRLEVGELAVLAVPLQWRRVHGPSAPSPRSLYYWLVNLSNASCEVVALVHHHAAQLARARSRALQPVCGPHFDVAFARNPVQQRNFFATANAPRYRHRSLMVHRARDFQIAHNAQRHSSATSHSPCRLHHCGSEKKVKGCPHRAGTRRLCLVTVLSQTVPTKLCLRGKRGASCYKWFLLGPEGGFKPERTGTLRLLQSYGVCTRFSLFSIHPLSDETSHGDGG